jgi:isoleucyl-tRNA synthetase
VVETVKGRDLEYMEYEQLMPFISVDKKAFYVTLGDYVSTADGTGIVHTAPAFGEDDYVTGRKYGLPVPNPVDGEGKYTQTPWAGRFVMEEGLDIDIIKYLAAENKIYSKEKIEHNYPHCWRCSTQLVYYGTPSWYIEMTKLRDQLVASNDATNWFPPFVGEGRFGNWVADVKDWAISRSRYWGTPINIWRCPCGHLESIGSRAELVEKAIEDIDAGIELHRPDVDDVHIRCPECGDSMARIPEVLDCWFDSGAMPFAQHHYPFENEDIFDEKLFPADFICEGIDQTRGWFYSLMAISTFIKGRSSYRNVLVNDLVLDKEGKKMSKSRGNSVDPFELFDKYGADATRWYLMYVSPVWFPTRFDEEGLVDVQGKFFGTLRNVYNFFTLYANNDGIDPSSFSVEPESRPELDRWILSKYHRLVQEVTAAMDAYDHNRSVRRIQDFVAEDLSNWYIRRARRRFYADDLTDDKKSVYATTYEVLEGTARLIAPFAPFIADELYIRLTGAESVHLADYPGAETSLIDDGLEERMDLVRSIVTMARGIREKTRIKVRQPLQELLIDGKYEETISYMSDLIREELNVKQVVFEKEMERFIDYGLKPDFKVAGPVLGPKIKAFVKALAGSNAKQLVDSLSVHGEVPMDLDGEEVRVTSDMVDIAVSAKEGFTVALENDLCVILDTDVTEALATEGLARELISKVQQLRKQKDFDMMDRIHIYVDAPEAVQAAILAHDEYIRKETLADSIVTKRDLPEFDLNGQPTGIDVERV